MLHTRGRCVGILIGLVMLTTVCLPKASAVPMMHHVQGPNPAQIQAMIQHAQQQQQRMMQQLQQMMQQRAQMMQQQQQQMMRQAQVAQQQMARQASINARRQQINNRNLQRRASAAQRNMARQMRNMPRPVLENVVAEYQFIVADDGIVRSTTILNPELDENGKDK